MSAITASTYSINQNAYLKGSWRSRQNAAVIYHGASLIDNRIDRIDSLADDHDFLAGSRAQQPTSTPHTRPKKAVTSNPKVAKNADRFESLWNHFSMDDDMYGDQVFVGKHKAAPETLAVFEHTEPEPGPSTPLPALFQGEVHMNKKTNTLMMEF